MRVLQLHCDHIEYTPVKREIASAEDAEPVSKRIDDVLVAFVAVEDGDSGVAKKAAAELRKLASRIGCGRLLLYPYAHLSSNLAPPQTALEVLREIESELVDIEVSRAPFGWTKSYSLKVKGHPLAEGSRVILPDGADHTDDEDAPEALDSESRLKSLWYVLTPDGKMHDAAGFDYTDHPRLEALARYESAKKRTQDGPPPHVGLMKKLAIADYEPASDSGNMRFFPNGRLIKSLIERYVTDCVRQYGGCEVETPIMYDSHHPSMASYFNRFPARQYSIDSEGRKLFLRFAACFGQFLMSHDMQISYRHLPYRLYELTRYSFRREQSGELVGLRRLRAFTMPDCHAFCKDMPQAIAELETRFGLSHDVLVGLGLERGGYEMAIRMTEDFYRDNGDVVRGLASKHGRPVLVEMWKERFFYFVLKWEFNYVDSSGRASALSTDQIDVENGERYGIEFVDEDGSTKNPVILHNSPSGAVERVIYALLEGAATDAAHGVKPELPLWLAPTQVRIIPLKEEFFSHCTDMAAEMARGSIRADVDDRNESIGRRIRDAEKEWIRYILVVGEKEASSGRLSVRDRKTGQTREMTPDELAGEIHKQTDSMPFIPLNQPVLLSRRPQIML